jgi:hypothetical protein
MRTFRRKIGRICAQGHHSVALRSGSQRLARFYVHAGGPANSIAVERRTATKVKPVNDCATLPRFSALFTLAVLAIFASSAAAQAPASRHIELRIAPELALSLTGAAPPPPLAKASHKDMITDLRRSRAMVAVGIGLLLSGAAGMAWGANACDELYSPRVNNGFLAGGGAVAAAGVAFTVRGQSRLKRTDQSLTRMSGSLIALTLGTLLTSAALWFGAGTPEWIECVSS